MLYSDNLLNCIWQLVLVLGQLASHLIKMEVNVICGLSLKFIGMVKKDRKKTNVFFNDQSFPV